jgi:choline dehydrogenase
LSVIFSGIGNGDQLSALGIEILHHLPGVGANLQDHLEVYVQCLSKEPVTLYPYQWSKPHNMIRVGLEWLLNGSGICASNHLESGAFVKSNDTEEWPNIQFHFLPAAIGDQVAIFCHQYEIFSQCYLEGSTMLDFGHAFQVHVGPLRSKSKGFVTIKSANPNDDPLIDPNFLSLENDFQEFRSAIRITRKIFSQAAFQQYNCGERIPGPSVETDEQIDQFISEKGESAYHPCGTCKLGADDDPTTVVNHLGQVKGLNGLWVADASIMPTIVSSNLNCPSIMIGEKISDSFH